VQTGCLEELVKTYTLKLINGEEIEVNADGYDVFYDGKMIAFYIMHDGKKKNVLNVVMQNILFMGKV